MKLVAPACLVLGTVSMLAAQHPQKETTLLIGGNFQGFLSPCGCTAPMSGGIKRAANVIRQLSASGDSIYIISGGLVAGIGRQDELKAEALAEYGGNLSARAIAYTESEARLGLGEGLQLNQLSKGKLLNSQLTPRPELSIADSTVAGLMVVGTAFARTTEAAKLVGAEAVDLDASVNMILSEAKYQGALPIVMTDGGEDLAARLARKHPDLAAVVYRSEGDPPSQPGSVGRTVLLTPGSKGKTVVSIRFRGSEFTGYSVIRLGPEYKDDPAVSRIYDRYLARVESEHLLDLVSRRPSEPYSGSGSCLPCHAKAYRVWENSGHHKAYRTLLSQKHGKDPDCVTCHVVGLNSTGGFRSLSATPRLANVGCESCHGPALRHARAPRAHKLPKVAAPTCLSCHTSENSPGFDFKQFWPRIVH